MNEIAMSVSRDFSGQQDGRTLRNFRYKLFVLQFFLEKNTEKSSFQWTVEKCEINIWDLEKNCGLFKWLEKCNLIFLKSEKKRYKKNSDKNIIDWTGKNMLKNMVK
jgi:hypothetical protein